MKAVTAYIGLGANLDDPTGKICEALKKIEKIPGVLLGEVSSFYKTAPVGFEEQDDFVNIVCSAKCSIGAFHLLEELHDIEQEFGRIRSFLNGPRIIDLDLLLYGGLFCNTADVTIPHPRMLDRAFVLVPLQEIAPNFVLPSGVRIADLLPRVLGQRIERSDFTRY